MSQQRERILDIIVAKLGLIRATSTNPCTGYVFRTDIGREVKVGDDSIPDANNAPYCNAYNLSEDINPREADNTNKFNARKMSVTVEAILRDGGLSLVQIANMLIDDVESVLLYNTSGVRDITLGGKVESIIYINHNPFLLNNDTDTGGIVAVFDIEYDPEDALA